MNDWKVKFLRKLFFYKETVEDLDISDRLEEFIDIEYDLIVDSHGTDYFIYEEDGFRIWIDQDIEADKKQGEEDNRLKRLEQWLERKNLIEWLNKMYIKE
jgi:cytidylate kinase